MSIANQLAINVMITSVGRRNYLVDWFRSAADDTGNSVRIIAADSDPHAPGLANADDHVVLPNITSPEYLDHLVDACRTRDVALLLSVHDYDIATISKSGIGPLESIGVTAAVPPGTTLDVVGDKVHTTETLLRAGLKAPETYLATDRLSLDNHGRWVVKHRYGSGSSGVFIVDTAHLPHAVVLSSLTSPRSDGSHSPHPESSLVVVQEMVVGQEFGIDVVCDFNGQYQGVLARKKLRMRAGETDRAVTVDAAPFESLARTLAATLELRGNTDVDVIVTPDGGQYIIDINPRFGGGYPFVHIAGANVPACYLAWATGLEIDPKWLRYEHGVVGSKYGAIHRSGL
jgi:carbamoyl-phosphate synthase large subunit